MMVLNCSRCSKEWSHDGELPRRGNICFACHVKSVNLGFTYGKEDFHGPTVRERQQQQVADAAKNGVNAEPVGSRWV